jgi:hypothetical protein
MTVKELLNLVGGDREIIIRYEIEVVYSEYTTGSEDVLVKLDETAVLPDENNKVILAADLCE